MAKKNKAFRYEQSKHEKGNYSPRMDYDSKCPVWYFDRLDKSGPFAFDTSRRDFRHREFIDKMVAYSNMTWADIKRQTHDDGKSKHHILDEAGFSHDAVERIKAKHMEEDTDEIFSFAFQNLLRVIGVKQNEEFHVVWYDANHQFYPSKR